MRLNARTPQLQQIHKLYSWVAMVRWQGRGICVPLWSVQFHGRQETTVSPTSGPDERGHLITRCS